MTTAALITPATGSRRGLAPASPQAIKVWWKTPDEALRQPDRVVAQVMNIGDYEDVLELVEQMG